MKINIIYKSYSSIIPYKNNPKKHPKGQIEKLVNSIKEFGFNSPIIVDNNNIIICGHARYEALGEIDKNSEVPCVLLETLTPSQIKAYRIADNKIASLGEWDESLLIEELTEIKLKDDVNPEILGFEQGELDNLLKPLSEEEPILEDEKENKNDGFVTKLGDIWLFDGKHKLLCGDSLIEENYKILFGDKRAALCVSDPPYNMRGRDISRGQTRQKDFCQASGEMTDDEFVDFLYSYIKLNVKFSEKTSMFFYCINWQKHRFMDLAGEKINLNLKNICVWDVPFDLTNICLWKKNNGGMGGIYRNTHEFIYVYSFSEKYTNNVKLGVYGRNRTNVWEYQMANNKDKEDHSTIKPLQMIIDIILDASKYNDIVLDSFIGSGTTIHACQASNRIGYGLELDPQYVDVSIKRFQRYYPNVPIVLLETGETFEEVRDRRCYGV